MRAMKLVIAGAAAVALAAAPFTAALAADSHAATDPAAPGEAIRLPLNADQLDTLNPFTVVFAVDVLNYEYEPLAGIVETGDYGGILAERFTVDGKVWTYTLRENAMWSDGEPITSDDVVWTYEAVKNDEALQVADGQVVANVEKVTAVDDRTVQIETTAPTPIHPGLLRIVPKHIWEKIENPAEYPNTENVVGSGPFVVDDYQEGTSISMRANEHYWRGKPGVNRLHFIAYKNKDAMALALRNGEIDMIERLSAAHFESLSNVAGVTASRTLSKHFWNLTINGGWKTKSGKAYGTQNPVLEDQAFRRAIGQAIDRKALVEKIINGLGSEGPTILPPGSPGGFYTDLPGISLPQGVDEAKKSLEAAGYTTDAQGNRLDKSGKPITLRMMFDGTSTANTDSAAFVESWFGELGIELNLKNTNWDEMLELIPKGDYDIYVDGWGVSDDPDWMLSINTCDNLPSKPGGSTSSQSGMCDPEYDKIFEAQHTELDPAKRKELVTEALSKIYEYGNTPMLYYDDDLGAYRSDRLENLVEVNGSVYNRFSLAQATIKKNAASSSSGAAPAWVLGVGVCAIVLLAAGVAVVAVRRRRNAAERR